MEIGLNGLPPGYDCDTLLELQDFGIGWIKTTFDICAEEGGQVIDTVSQAEFDRVRGEAEQWADYGIRTVVDVRSAPEAISLLPGQKLKALQAQEAQEWEEASAEEKRRLVPIRAERASKIVADWIGELVYRVVDELGDVITDWEWWGEWQCPIVSTGSLPHPDYQMMLAVFYNACKQADPQCRVWNGGNGVAVSNLWLKELIAPHKRRPNEYRWFPAGIGEYFDCCNWHHYRITLGPGNEDYGLERVIQEYDNVFTETRQLLDEHGASQPFVASEWGIAMVDDEVIAALKDEKGRAWLKSYAYWPGWPALPVSRSAEWFQANLECFDRHGFEVLCIHEWQEHEQPLRDQQHWGTFCGLIDIRGEKRPCWYTVRDWAREHYGTAFKGG